MNPVIEVWVDMKTASQLWKIHGHYYDLEAFLARHPGGDVIELGRGRDCTELWESVHLLSDTPRTLLARFRVEPPVDAEPELNIYEWQADGFYSTLRRRVREHFDGTDGKATPAYFVRWGLLVAAWAGFLVLGLWQGSIVFAILAGLTIEILDNTVSHDGSHNAVSRKSWINKLASYTQYIYFWAHPVWAHHHVFAHHSYTGVQGLDPDLDNNFLQRKSQVQAVRWWHRGQGWLTWLYLPWFMTLVQSGAYMFSLIFQKPIFGVPFKRDYRELSVAVALWTVSVVVHFVVPFMLLPFWQALAVIAVYYMTQSFYYWAAVAPNHDTLATVRHGEASTDIDTLRQSPIDWGEKQVRSTSNFRLLNATVTRHMNWFFGGIQYQIEHHLFPTISHCHYPDLAPIVMRTCREFGVPYEAPTWGCALIDYQRALRHLSGYSAADSK